MKPTTLTIGALSGLLATAAAAEDYNVQRTLQLTASATHVWHLAGDFCDIDDWHPDILACSLNVIDGRLHRRLTTADGVEIVEQRIAAEHGLSYTYVISSAPFPIENYTATLSIESLDGALISWSANFSSDDPSMEALIGDFFDAGLSAIESSIGAE